MKKEFSEENIDFWVKCENFKKLSTPDEMRKGADDIWSTYLDTSAMHQINVDNKARSHCKEALQNPNNTMFEMAQNQVRTQERLDLFLEESVIKTQPAIEFQKNMLTFESLNIGNK